MTDQVTDIVDSTALLSNFEFVELTENMLTDKAFDGLVAGEFTDMHGRAVKITRANLAEIVKNTTALLETTRTEGGELAGLPIDEVQHNKGHASGWIVGVELVGDVLRIIPQWTELGRDLITKKIQRYFSATVDLAKQVLYGGTLTNWPATRDNKTGRVLLRPIELAEQATAENETPELPIPPNMENKIMTVELTQEVQDLISAKISEGIAAGLAAQPKQETQVDLSQLVEAFGLNTEKAEAQGLNHLNELAKQVEAQVNLRWQNILAEKQRENRYTELATKVTGGTTEYPRALPVTMDALKAALLKLPADQAQFWMDLCQNIVKSGLTEFAELGHGRDQKQGTRLLSESDKKQLKQFMKEGGTLDEFFAINAEFIGEQDTYNLSEFSSKEK